MTQAPKARPDNASGRQCFISYSRADSRTARALCFELERRDVSCWIDTRDAVPGRAFEEQIDQAIADSAGVILLLSRNSCKSPHVLREISLSDSHQKTPIPVRIEDIVPTGGLAYYLTSAQRVDLIGRPFDVHALNRLALALGGHEAKKPWWAFSKRTNLVLAYVLGCASIWLLGLKAAYEDSESLWAALLFSRAALYNFAASIGSGKQSLLLRQHQTIPVEINESTANFGPEDFCAERLYLGGLLERLEGASPDVVVLDKYFGKDRCVDLNGRKATQKLLSGIEKLCNHPGKPIPVVVGRYANDSRDESGKYRLDETLDFSSAGGCVKQALVDADPNHDYNRVFLFFPDTQGVDPQHPETHPQTLALAAALAKDHTLTYGRPGWQSNMDAPTASLLPPGEFKAVPARDIFCEECTGNRVLPAGIAGKIVVIGDNFLESETPDASSDLDIHRVGFDRLPGYKLQANYIESLLLLGDVRRFVPEWANDIAAFFFLIALELVRWRYPGNKAAMILAFGVSALLIYGANFKLQYHFNPTPVLAAAILYSKALSLVQSFMPYWLTSASKAKTRN